MRKAQAEVDNVLGDQQLQMEDLNSFPYLTGNILASHNTRSIVGKLILASDQLSFARPSASVQQSGVDRSRRTKILQSAMGNTLSRKDRQ